MFIYVGTKGVFPRLSPYYKFNYVIYSKIYYYYYYNFPRMHYSYRI